MMKQSQKQELSALIRKIALDMAKEMHLSGVNPVVQDLYELQDYLGQFSVVYNRMSIEFPDGSIIDFGDLVSKIYAEEQG